MDSSEAGARDTQAVLAMFVVCFVMFVAFVAARFIDLEALLGPAGSITYVESSPPARVDVSPAHLPFAVASVCAEDTVVKCAFTKSNDSPLRPASIRFRLYAGVSVPAFYHVLKAPWPWFKEAFLHGNLFGEAGCVGVGGLQTVSWDEADSELKSDVVRPAQGEDLQLGPMPRQRFPLVLCALSDDSTLEHASNEGRVGATLCAVHVRDDLCPLQSQILHTHVKHTSDRVTLLQRTFGSDDKCVACQESDVDCVLLPCQHACVCDTCFPKLKQKCPMCRSAITSFFPVHLKTS